MKLSIMKTEHPKQKESDPKKLGFGKLFTDHMLLMKYNGKAGWHDTAIVPFEDFRLSPAAAVFHYAQAGFEGLKAYRRADGSIALFRPWDNMRRMNATAKRICAPEIPEEEVLEALYELIRTDAQWVPSAPGTSLYIRPTIIATDPFLGVHPSHEYYFFIILSPVGAYYSSGLAPCSIYVEKDYVRSVKGGTGYVKAAANYAASLIATDNAEANNCQQVLWLDAIEKKYVEEVGAMNIFFKIDGEIITPELVGSILPGITRDSIMQIARKKGYKVTERRITIDEVIQAAHSGKLEEVFGTGTAAVLSPVGELVYAGEKIIINHGEMGSASKLFYDTLTGIQYGTVIDEFGWTVTVLDA